MRLTDVLIVPDRYDWITGRWAEQLGRALSRFRTVTVPSWYFATRPAFFRTAIAGAESIINLDPWFAHQVVRSVSSVDRKPVVASVLHHVNVDDPNAAAIARADLPVAACEAARECLVSLVGLSKEVLLVENGVDLEEFRPGDRTQCRKSVGLSGGDFVIGFLGKTSSDYRGRKGLDTLVEIIAALATEKRFKFVICGETEEAFRQKVTTLNPNVKCLGFMAQKELVTFYNSLSVLLMTSRIEAGPATVLEAMACGVAPVASNTGIVSKVVKTGYNGFCVEPGDADAFLAALRELAADPLRCRSMGKQARQAVEDNWGWQAKMAPFAAAMRVQLYGRGVQESSWKLGNPIRKASETYIRYLETRRHTVRWNGRGPTELPLI
jgi:glycosyltransferase involved in cell wall biosynthesis